MTTEIARQDPDLGNRVVTTKTSLGLRNQAVSMTLEEWAELGRQLGHAANSWLWWIGDWFRIGEKTYGSTYKSATAITGLAYQTLAQVSWVARSIESSRRRENLSFSHHVEVAGLAPWAQDQWLSLAEREGLTHKALRARIRGDRELPAAPPFELLRLSAPPERAERWKAAAERAGVDFDEWAASALDEAAA